MQTGAPAHLSTILSLAAAERPMWDAISAGIPAWHPRNEDPPAPDAAAAATDQAAAGADADQAAASATQAAGDELALPFSLDEIGEDFTLQGPAARDWITARQAQMQGALTKRTQQLAQQTEQLGEWGSLVARLEDEETKREALIELLDKFDLDLPDEWGAAPAASTETPAAAAAAGETELDPATQALADRVAELEAERTASAEAEAAETAERAHNAHIVASLDAFAVQQLGEGKQAEDLTQQQRDDLLTRAMALPRRADGFLDFDQAIANHLDYRQHVAAEERARYLASKDTPGVTPGSAAHGTQAVDLSDKKTRLERAAAVAGRHY